MGRGVLDRQLLGNSIRVGNNAPAVHGIECVSWLGQKEAQKVGVLVLGD